MRKTIELQKSINIKGVLAYIQHVYQPSRPLVEDDGEYGLYQYEYLDRHHNWKEVSILLDYIVPNYGGRRYLLVCRNCERRVLRLYVTSTDVIACRHCLQLEYGSRQFQSNPLMLAVTNSQRARTLVYRRHRYANKPTATGIRYSKYLKSIKKATLPTPAPE